jgi:hypothetical protein
MDKILWVKKIYENPLPRISQVNVEELDKLHGDLEGHLNLTPVRSAKCILHHGFDVY